MSTVTVETMSALCETARAEYRQARGSRKSLAVPAAWRPAMRALHQADTLRQLADYAWNGRTGKNAAVAVMTAHGAERWFDSPAAVLAVYRLSEESPAVAAQAWARLYARETEGGWHQGEWGPVSHPRHVVDPKQLAAERKARGRTYTAAELAESAKVNAASLAQWESDGTAARFAAKRATRGTQPVAGPEPVTVPVAVAERPEPTMVAAFDPRAVAAVRESAKRPTSKRRPASPVAPCDPSDGHETAASGPETGETAPAAVTVPQTAPDPSDGPTAPDVRTRSGRAAIRDYIRNGPGEPVGPAAAEPVPAGDGTGKGDALADYLARLVHAPKREYAQAFALYLAGGPEPVAPAADWADQVARKVRRFARMA